MGILIPFLINQILRFQVANDVNERVWVTSCNSTKRAMKIPIKFEVSIIMYACDLMGSIFLIIAREGRGSDKI